jgi:hypothetical protein
VGGLVDAVVDGSAKVLDERAEEPSVNGPDRGARVEREAGVKNGGVRSDQASGQAREVWRAAELVACSSKQSTTGLQRARVPAVCPTWSNNGHQVHQTTARPGRAPAERMRTSTCREIALSWSSSVIDTALIVGS